MASIIKRGGIWTARIRVGGRERWRSLGTGDRQEAERRAKALEEKLSGNRWLRQELDALLARADQDLRDDEVPLVCETLGRAIDRLLKRIPESARTKFSRRLSRDLAGERHAKVAIDEAWEKWLGSSNRETGSKARTIAGYKAIWLRFQHWGSARQLQWLHEVGEVDALAYADHLWQAPVTPRTLSAHVRFIRSVWATLRVPAGLEAANPWDAVKSKPRAHGTGRRALTPDEIRRVIAAADGSFRVLLLTGALTGARLGDVVNMRWREIDLDRAEWSLVPMKTSRLGKRLLLPLLEPLLGELRKFPAVDRAEHVFPKELELWTRGDLTKRIQAHFLRCAIDTQEQVEAGQQRKRARVVAGFHSLRHSAATISAKSGVNLGLVQQALGHASIGVTMGYLHGDSETARQVLAPLAAILRTSDADSDPEHRA
ncbi:MAG: tyrosine-type recombinase/integrase [Verrucomicrobiales bacterium]|nr:tyrosine-type recombinase/integrase [Verrucomicrobiales bacterium]